MNIFITNLDPEICAMDHCDTHVVKQILENYQMLSTVQRHFIGNRKADELGLYKTAHPNHPCTKWIRESSTNYNWLVRLTVALGEIYEAGRGKPHASQEKLLDKLLEPPRGIPDAGWTSPALAMPTDVARSVGFDTTLAYQKYVDSKYIDWMTRVDKRQITPVWWTGEAPEWVSGLTRALLKKQ